MKTGTALIGARFQYPDVVKRKNREIRHDPFD